jgi:hypothetical protein
MEDFATALRGHLGNVLANPETFREFRQWFMTAWWDAESAVSDEVYEAGVSNEHLFYMLDSGVWSEADFWRELDATRRTLEDRSQPLKPAAAGRHG